MPAKRIRAAKLENTAVKTTSRFCIINYKKREKMDEIFPGKYLRVFLLKIDVRNYVMLPVIHSFKLSVKSWCEIKVFCAVYMSIKCHQMADNFSTIESVITTTTKMKFSVTFLFLLSVILVSQVRKMLYFWQQALRNVHTYIKCMFRYWQRQKRKRIPKSLKSQKVKKVLWVWPHRWDHRKEWVALKEKNRKKRRTRKNFTNKCYKNVTFFWNKSEINT